MSNSIILFQEENLSIKEKFYILMNLIVTDKTKSIFESYLFLVIFFIQFLSIFYSKPINVLNGDDNVSDKILIYISLIFRFKELLFNYPFAFKIVIYCIGIYLIYFTIFFLICLLKINYKSSLNFQIVSLNYMFKFLCYLLFNITLDLFTIMLCFGRENNLYFTDIKCNQKNNILPFIIGFFNALYITLLIFFLEFFYEDSFYLSSSPCCKMTSPLHHILYIICILLSIMSSLIDKFHHGFFFIVNLILSSFLLFYYLNRLIIYDQTTMLIFGIFFVEYIWTSIFFFVFYYLELTEKGLIYFLSSCFVGFLTYIILEEKKNKIIKSTPYHKISNKYYLLFYLRTLIYYIDNISDPIIQSNLIAIMQLHIIECPNECCILKTKDKLYLPLNNEWSDRTKPFIHDKILLKHFIIVVMNYFVSINHYSPEMIINLSHYYLIVIGNICMSLFYYQKVKGMKLTIQEHFLLKRLEIIISGILVEKLKPVNEACFNLNELNISYYFKYFNCAEKFIKSVYSDLDLCLEFWDNYKEDKSQEILDYNKIFHILEKITKSKENVKVLWNKLFNIYSGINDLFDFYLDYVTNINDDSFLSRDLETIKRKNENSIENIQLNYYNLMFNKETGIIIINGNRGNEGKIEKANERAGEIFKYNNEIMRGMNINQLMPKIFAVEHNNYIKKYFETGEKKIINTKGHKIFGIDKDNNILYLSQTIQLFPILNNDIYFISMMINEKVDDLIFIDSDYIIQGMSEKLMNKLNLTNKFLFYDNEIPFYMICKQFLGFYKIFLKDNKSKKNKNLITVENKEESDDDSIEEFIGEDEIQKEKIENIENDNIEINENIELEYEIKIPNFLISFSQITMNKDREFNKEISNTSTLTTSKSIFINNNTPFESSLTYTIGRKGTNNSNNNNNNNNETELENNENLKTIDEEESLLSKGITPTTPIKSHKNLKVNFAFKKSYDRSIKMENSFKTTNSKKESNCEINRSRSNILNLNQYFKKSNPESEGLHKINLYQQLFKDGKYDQIEKLIDNDVKDENSIQIKFNFTFEKYSFGENQCVYIIRCINNKNENKSSSNTSDTDNLMNDDHNQIKRRLEKFKKNYQILKEEREIFTENIKNLNKLVEEEKFRNLITDAHNDILVLSKIYGKHHVKVIEDENSSQSSLSGYNSDLSKMSRIQEIRKNLTIKVPHSNIILYLKILPIFWFILTLFFGSLYIYNFNIIETDIVKLGEFASNLLYNELQLARILIILLETYTMFYFRNDKDHNMSFYETISENEYFMLRKREGLRMVDTSFNITIDLIRNSRKFKIDKFNFWEKLNVKFFIETPFQYNESFILIILDVLADIINLFNLKEFSFNNYNISEEVDLEILYSKFSSIEGGYGIILPSIFAVNSLITSNIVSINNSYKIQIKFFIYVFGLISVILVLIYNYCLWNIIFYMGRGMEKITKISQDKIDDCIRRIDIFENFYKKKFEYIISKKDIKSSIRTQVMLNIEKRQTQTQNFFLTKYSKKNSTINFLNRYNKLNDYNSNKLSNSFNNQNKSENNSNINQQNNKNKIDNNNSNIDKLQNSVNNNNLDVSVNMNSTNELLESKKIKKLKMTYNIFIYAIIIIILIIGLITLMFYFNLNFIVDNSYLLWSRVYLIENFLYTTSSILYMQCNLVNCNGTGQINRSDIVNASLESILYKTLPKFPKLFNFYYNEYLVDVCASIYGFNNDDYFECLNNVEFIENINNTNSMKDYILKHVNLLIYENTIYIQRDENFDCYSLLSSDEFGIIMILFRKFYINSIHNLNNVLKKSTEWKAHKEFINIIICLIILTVLIGINYVYNNMIFIRNLINKYIISRSFVMIIPCYYIMKTQELDNWLEKIDLT